MIRKLYFVLLSITMSIGFGYGQAGSGSIKGSVIDGKTKEPVAFAQVVLIQGGIVRGGAETDENGKFDFPSVTAGSYDIEVRSMEHQALKMESVSIRSEQIT